MLADLTAGTAAGFAICLVGHPFDTLKVLMQMQPDKYRGMIEAGRTTVSSHGLAGLYKGVASPLVGNAFYNAVQFAAFSSFKKMFTENGAKDTLNRVAGAGAVTGVFAAFVEGPQDLVKSQMQAQMMKPAAAGAEGAAAGAGGAPRYASTADCAKTILKQRGFAGLGQGLVATMCRNTLGVSAYFYFYELARRAQAGGKPVSELSTWQVLAAGGCGGLGYWVLSYPFDIIKSAIQTDALQPSARKYGSVPDTARKLWAEGGVKRYTAGLAPCLVRSIPANAAGFAAYETVLKMLQ